jgi:nitrate reductase delta subunit
MDDQVRDDAREAELVAALAELLSYPNERTAGAVRTVLGGGDPVTGAALAPFRERSRGVNCAAPEADLLELYTSTFDLQPACAPYVGHHLLGEDSPLRGPLLARLAEIYAAHGFAPREELGDHVAEVLRFLAVAPPSPERDDLVRDGLLPALGKMIASFEDPGHPYREVLVLTERTIRGSHHAAVSRRGHEPARRVAP